MKKRRDNSVLTRVLLVGLIVIIVAFCSCLIWINSCIKEIRNIDLNLDIENSVCYVVDADGNEKKITNENNTPIKLENINVDTINAFLSIEDKDFYKHKGINIKRIVKSIIDNVSNNKIVSGGSTITQQLIKNKYLSNEQTLKRKVQEIYLAKKLEAKYSKDKILESYLNEIYYGNGAFGIENASRRFFSKSASELNLSESCVLAASINSPARYSPINNIENSLSRRNLILNEMLKDKKISKEKYDSTIDSDIILNPSEIKKDNKDTYDIFAINEAANLLNVSINDIYRNGYKIYTGKSSKVQEELDKLINDDKYYHKNSYGNIADSLSMIIDNESNMVSAISGRSEYDLYNLKRQPGSLVKPILVYAPAIEEGLINSATQILDSEIDYDGYSPNNVGGISNEYVSVKDAISRSMNIPAIKVCNMLGIDKCKMYAKRCGLSLSNKDNGLAIALGGVTDGFALQNILDAYSPLIYSGIYKKSNIIKCIKDNSNLTIYNNKMTENTVFNTDTSYIMTKILQKSTKDGTSKKLSNIQYDIAGKTGTVAVHNTNLNTDIYSLAYTTKHRFMIWMGDYSMDKKYHLEGVNNGGTFATEFIKDTANILYKNNTPEAFRKPPTVDSYDIDIMVLENEHKVTLAGNIPDRYKQSILLSKRHLPEHSTNEYYYPTDLVVKSNIDGNEIIFKTNKYMTYKLYKDDGENSIVLASIKNKDNVFTYNDIDIVRDKVYTYYVESYNLITDRYDTSNKVKICNKSVHDNTDLKNNYDWLFATKKT